MKSFLFSRGEVGVGGKMALGRSESVSSFSQQPFLVAMIIPILEMGKLRPPKIRQYAQCHVASNWENRNCSLILTADMLPFIILNAS